MRICDKCHAKHANYRVWDYDFCYPCIEKFREWVECINCNKEEGEFIPQSEPEYHIDETIDKNRNVIMRRLMQGNKIIQEDFGKCSECGYYICRCPDKQ